MQYSQSLVIREEIGRLVEIVPGPSFRLLSPRRALMNMRLTILHDTALFLLTFFVNRPNSIKLLPSQLLQFLLFVLCVATGTTLIHINATSNYLQVMNVAPGVATLWIWSVVQLDLVPALLGLIGVALSVFLRGEGESVIWWR